MQMCDWPSCRTASPERVDVSNGWDGLPKHSVLRAVDTPCQPVGGAIVEIWHTQPTGGYSGRIVAMCNNHPTDILRRPCGGRSAHGPTAVDGFPESGRSGAGRTRASKTPTRTAACVD
jgi:hypothetical protein